MTAMLRTTRALRSLTTQTQTAQFSIAARRMAAGDTGAPRSGGVAQGDSFTKREEASENLYIKQQEREKLRALKAKIAQQEEELAKHKKEAEHLEQKK
ncbi:hypothetical protein K461DRAFT_279941 [Myriangium duriaei CBS 260.36]|uniref:ATPase inhibitor, mitochondrial n=1 Tax=Myriangium duriaei CBS 260.36 TaxID=1168546 RepID=A0A9P4MIL2_9PEZI|nr:hypothetical protein K461DRAFT_279941 [Myriangium duriaei CBS 260.36]